MKPKIIRTEEAYAAALAWVGALMDAKPGSASEAIPSIPNAFLKRFGPLPRPSPGSGA